jgi:hypothetical protein
MSNTRKKRIFGMTATQLMILGCLTLAAIGVIFGSFVFISSPVKPGGLSILPSPVPQVSSVDVTVPSNLVDESNPVQTPTLVLGNYDIPPDWKQHSSATIEVKVPPQFVASENIGITRQERVGFYRGRGFESLAAGLENDPFDYRFWFDFPQSESVPYRTHITVKADVLPTFTLDEYIDQAYGAELQGFQVSDRQVFAIENLEARRVLMDANLNGTAIRLADYVITDEVNLWIVSGSSVLEEFESWLPVFDRVASSFRLRY